MRVTRGDLVKIHNWTDGAAPYVYGIVLGYVPTFYCWDEYALHKKPEPRRAFDDPDLQGPEVSIQIGSEQYYFYEVEVVEVLSSGSLHSLDKIGLTFEPTSSIIDS